MCHKNKDLRWLVNKCDEVWKYFSSPKLNNNIRNASFRVFKMIVIEKELQWWNLPCSSLCCVTFSVFRFPLLWYNVRNAVVDSWRKVTRQNFYFCTHGTGTVFENSPLDAVRQNLTFLDCHELFCGSCVATDSHLMARHSSEEPNNGAGDAEQCEQ